MNNVSGNSSAKKLQKFDESKSISSEGANMLNIRSNHANIFIVPGNTENVDVHFCGEAMIDGEPILDIHKSGREVTVMLKIDVCELELGLGLMLEVKIPMSTFVALRVGGDIANIDISNGVSVDKMHFSSNHGNVMCKGNFTEIVANTYNGNIWICTTAQNDVGIDAATQHGNVTMEFHNVTSNKILTFSRNGKVEKTFCETQCGYTAYGQVGSYNGNITVKLLK